MAETRITGTIHGSPQSKANSRRWVTRRNRGMFVKSQVALQYVKDFRMQARRAPKLLEGDVVVEIRIWYRSLRTDLDESLILDLLQGIAYVNDRQVKEKHIFHMGTSDKPRVEYAVWAKGE